MLVFLRSALRALVPLGVCLFCAAAARAAEAGAEMVAVVEQRPLALYFFQSNGLIFGPLMVLLALALAFLVLDLLVRLRPGRAADLSASAEAGPARLAEQARRERSFLAQAIAAGLERLPHGLEEARHAATAAVEQRLARSESDLRWLGGLAILSPAVGLLGTLFGLMLLCMSESAGSSALLPRLADGLGHALTVVLEGLFLGCLAVPAYVVFKNRLRRVMLSTSSTADELLTRAHDLGQR